jgi:hypothetical protein
MILFERHYFSRLLFAGLLTVLTCQPTTGGETEDSERIYQLRFKLELSPADLAVNATISVMQDEDFLRVARFRAPEDRFSDFHGDGRIERIGDVVHWHPPKTGGDLHYQVTINHRRNDGAFDALISERWAIFRGDDIFPSARVTHASGALSASELIIDAPNDWSTVTPYLADSEGRMVVDDPERRFDRPTGWIISGELGVRRDDISGVEVSIAAPVGAGTQRISMLALLRWTLPYLVRELDQVGPGLSIVSANDPMWRGGLSASNSLFVHAARPMMSENGTSTLLHEIVHVLMPLPTVAQHDWIDEGIAEYVTLDILKRSGTISVERFDAAIAGFARRGNRVKTMATTQASGNVTARAVVILQKLDAELQQCTDGEADIYQLTRRISAQLDPVDLAQLRQLARDICATGGRPDGSIDSLSPGQVPGFDN